MTVRSRPRPVPARATPVAVAALALLLATPPARAQLTVVQTASESLTVGAWVQPASTFRTGDGDDGGGFFLRRFRLDLQGSLLEGRVRFRFNPDLAYDPQPFDLWVEVRGGSGLSLRMGQTTVPFNLEREKHMGRAHFGERSVPALAFELSRGRDIGAVLTWRNQAADRQIAVGAFNGLGPNTRAVGTDPLVAARGIVALGGPIQSGITDITRTESPVVNLGAGIMYAPRSGLRGGPPADWATWTLDAVLRASGYSAAVAVFGETQDRPGAGADADGAGWFLSGGWIPAGRDLQLSARYGEADADRTGATDPSIEASAGITLFHQGHELQTRIQFIHLDSPAGGGRVRTNQITVETQILLGG